MPAPPRTMVSELPWTSQLKPSRGDQSGLPLGTLLVSMGSVGLAATAALVTCEERKGTSMRRPGVTGAHRAGRGRARPEVSGRRTGLPVGIEPGALGLGQDERRVGAGRAHVANEGDGAEQFVRELALGLVGGQLGADRVGRVAV